MNTRRGLESPPPLQPNIGLHNINETQHAWHPRRQVGAEDRTLGATSEHGGKSIDEGKQFGPKVQDLKWNMDTVHSQLVADGVNNTEIWTLLRRFNKQIFRVRSTGGRPLTDLDMNDASGEKVSVERLRAHMERLYMTIIVSLYSLHKHIIRLRSWKEKPRTLLFLAVYVVSWLTGIVALALTCFAVVLIAYPPARDACFPPVPPSLIDPKTGGVQEPLAGELSSNSVTGAPEKQAGEAVEQEAHNFITSVGRLMLSVSSGSHDQNEPHEGDILPTPSVIAEAITSLQNKAGHRESNERSDKTKEPVSRAVESFEIHTAIRILPDLIDNWERLENALSPTSPFHPQQPRLTLATCLLPLVFVFGFVSWDHIMKGIGFMAGFGFFGSPIIAYCVAFMDTLYPDCRQFLQLRNTVLRGVPTNAQLAVTILRVGERNSGPIPPPPTAHQSPSPTHQAKSQDLSTVGASQGGTQTTTNPVSDREESSEGGHGNSKSKMTHRVTNGLKRMVKSGVQPALKVSKAAAPIGGKHAKRSLGAFDAPLTTAEAGPVCFPARYGEENGNTYVMTEAFAPSIGWSRGIDGTEFSWTVPLNDIVELRKVGGMGWKRKFIISWATDCEVADGLVLKTKQGTEFFLTAVAMRDEVFNRLLSIGNQTWEIW